MGKTWQREAQRVQATEVARKNAEEKRKQAAAEREKDRRMEREFRQMERQAQVEALERLYRQHGLKGGWPCPWFALFGQCAKGTCGREHKTVPTAWLEAVAAQVAEAPAPMGNRAPAKAPKAPKKELEVVSISAPPLPTLDAFPELPEPAPAVAPLGISRPVMHVPTKGRAAERETVSEVSECETASVATARSSATTTRASSCTYCRSSGHVTSECPALAHRLCSYCRCSGHTEKFCEMRRLDESWNATLEREAAILERRIDRALRVHELEMGGWCTVGKAAVAPSEPVCTPVCRPVCEPCVEAPAAKKPSRAQRQAAKRLAAKASCLA